MDIRFYHLSRKPVEEALPQLLETVSARGHKILVAASDKAQIDGIDKVLWTYKGDSFLPHDTADSPYAADQKILLTEGSENTNGADVLVLFDGIDHGLRQKIPMTLMMFDGSNDDVLNRCRLLWKSIKESDAMLTYWQQSENGSWQKKQ